MFEQRARKPFRRMRRNADLEPVLARVAGSRDDALSSRKTRMAHIEKAQGDDLRSQRAQHLLGLRALQRNERAIRKQLHAAAVFESAAQPFAIGILAARVDDEQPMIAAVGDHGW